MDQPQPIICRVLMVDDDEDDYLLTRTMLDRAYGRKYQLEWASTYEQGEQLLLQAGFDAVLVDYDLGARTGIELIRKVVSRGCTSPLILYTGRGSFEVDVEAMQAGATLYLTKDEANPLLLERAIRYAIERKEAEQALAASQQRLAGLVASAMDAIVSINEEQRIVLFNPAAERMFGVPADEAQGQPIENYIPRRYHTRYTKQLQAFAVEGVNRLSMTAPGIVYGRRANGEKFPIEASISQTTISGHKLFTVILRDITERIQAEQKLEEARMAAVNEQRRLEAVMEALPSGLAILDAQGEFIHANQMYERIWGGPRPAPLSVSNYAACQAWWVDTGEPVRLEEWASARAVQKGETTIGQVMHIQRFDGEHAYILNSAAPILDAQGKIAGCVVSVLDITERISAEQALKESDQRFRYVLSHMPVVVANVDRELRYTWVYNPQVGFKAVDVLGKTVGLATDAESAEHILLLLRQVLATGAPAEWETAVRSNTGEKFYTGHAEAMRNEGGEITGIALIAFDITARKQVEAALQDYTAQLKRSNDALQDFAFIASHDLREPLRKIHAFGDLLLAHYPQALDEPGRDYVERMQQAAGRMESMLDGLLEYARLPIRSRPFASIDLHQVAVEVIADLEMRILQTGGNVELGDLPVIEADEVQMRELLQNLIGNALKFHRAEIAPKVMISSTLVPENCVEITVADNGVGFDMRNASQLFKPFRRFHERSDFEGSGMGLAICQKIVERHGGTIAAHSAPGEGTEFRVTLPLKQIL